MSIIINIKPEALKELTRLAAAHGVQPEDYAAALLEGSPYGRTKEAHAGPARPDTAGACPVFPQDSTAAG